MKLLSIILTILALIFISFGLIGLFRFKNFYSRILITSKVETLGFITLMISVILYSGFTYFSLKVLLICILSIITNPLSTHAITRSALKSGYKINKEQK